ncbi:transcriptional regulator, ArsR family [Methanocaldococcus sp. FS406-22]|uniref:winged helix-turn-helix transcriptional regulator n=1 Tax=Methanocaldococcus sp. (strain FS406-22) TaxID=644281 RepID=UPI0001BF57AE|nr:winged helix-turn-helix transcriptional regulator [Methanocaldococcus sp. FS406-22]ADC68947.1 transcriptional regulator, ArsR family [Methanocaldococcus sp. FS406-22]
MKKATLLLITLILFYFVHVYGINVSLENISQYLYTDTVYLSYENGIPCFYVGEKKEFVIIPPYIKVDNDIAPLIKKLGFKIDNETYNLIITKKDVNTDKMAIIFAPINGSKRIYGNETVIWTNDPLKLKQSEVEALYTLPEKGKVIARYKNGKPAAIKINNKIYVGFKPNEEVLANLIYVHIVKRTSNPLPYILFTVILTLVSLMLTFQETLKKKFLDLISALASVKVFILSRVNILDEEKVLLNDTRREIYNYILDNPGCHLRELSKNLNKSVSTLTWHLRILEKANLVKSKKLGNKLIYYPANMDVRDLPLLYLKNETQKSIFEYLSKNSAHLRKIAKDLNLNVETVRYNLKKLENLGIVKAREEGNRVVYYINESILKFHK